MTETVEHLALVEQPRQQVVGWDETKEVGEEHEANW